MRTTFLESELRRSGRQSLAPLFNKTKDVVQLLIIGPSFGGHQKAVPVLPVGHLVRAGKLDRVFQHRVSGHDARQCHFRLVTVRKTGFIHTALIQWQLL